MATTLADPADKPLLRADDLIGVLPGMSRSAIYEAIARDDLPSLRIGRRLYIPNARLRDWLQLPQAGAYFPAVTS